MKLYLEMVPRIAAVIMAVLLTASMAGCKDKADKINNDNGTAPSTKTEENVIAVEKSEKTSLNFTREELLEMPLATEAGPGERCVIPGEEYFSFVMPEGYEVEDYKPGYALYMHKIGNDTGEPDMSIGFSAWHVTGDVFDDPEYELMDQSERRSMIQADIKSNDRDGHPPVKESFLINSNCTLYDFTGYYNMVSELSFDSNNPDIIGFLGINVNNEDSYEAAKQLAESMSPIVLDSAKEAEKLKYF